MNFDIIQQPIRVLPIECLMKLPAFYEFLIREVYSAAQPPQIYFYGFEMGPTFINISIAHLQYTYLDLYVRDETEKIVTNFYRLLN